MHGEHQGHTGVRRQRGEDPGVLTMDDVGVEDTDLLIDGLLESPDIS